MKEKIEKLIETYKKDLERYRHEKELARNRELEQDEYFYKGIIQGTIIILKDLEDIWKEIK